MEHVWTRCRVHIAKCGCKYSFYGTSKSEIAIFGNVIGTNYPEYNCKKERFIFNFFLSRNLCLRG